MSDRTAMMTRVRQSGLMVLSALALVGVVLLGALISLLPSSGVHCPVPGAWIMLDPGHGGEDPGAVNDGAGLVERDLVLTIARRTATLLEDAGYSVALTRDDNETGSANTPRGTMANLCHAVAYVSIHLNSFDEPEPNYAKTFWGQEDKDAAFAAVMQATLVARLQPGTDLGDAGLEQLENGGLLTARMQAVLVEPVFLSNADEAARLVDPGGERLEAIAAAIVEGIDASLRARGLGPVLPPVRSTTRIMTPSDRLVGPPRGSVAQVMAMLPLDAASRQDDLRAYVAEVYRLAPQVGLDPAIVIAQSALETGWWQSPAWTEHRNPAGLGITGPDVPSPSWSSGVDAARAHLVHLYLYAVGPIPSAHPLAAYLPLDPRYQAALSAGRAGSAATITDLAGRWATDPDYAEGISRVGSALFGSREEGGTGAVCRLLPRKASRLKHSPVAALKTIRVPSAC